MRFLLIGNGKMGKLIASTAEAAGDEIAAVFSRENLPELASYDGGADVVIDFSRPEALGAVEAYIRRTGIPLLSGTTGYSPAEKGRLEALGTVAPVLWSANFSLGVAVFVRALQAVSGVLKPDFALYSGNDDITVPLLSIGGSGVISVYANVMPAMCHQIVADYLSGNQAQAVANHLRYLRVMNDLFIEVNPIPVKSAMNMMGLNVGPMRLPLCEMSEEHSAVLRASLEEAGLL